MQKITLKFLLWNKKLFRGASMVANHIGFKDMPKKLKFSLPQKSYKALYLGGKIVFSNHNLWHFLKLETRWR